MNINKEEYINKIISIMKYKKRVYKRNKHNLLQLCLSN